MTTKSDDLGAVWRFLSSGLKTWDQTASLLPSQRFLVNALTCQPELKRAKTIVELGPGIGTVTRAILREAPSDAKIYSFEIDEKLVETATAAIVDPRLRFVHGSAADIDRILPELGCHDPVDVVVSSLGMSLLPADIRDDIMRSVAATLSPDGVYIQYAYFHARFVVWSPGRGLWRFNIRDYLSPRFADLQRKLIVANVPPAAVYTCRLPRRDQPAAAE